MISFVHVLMFVLVLFVAAIFYKISLFQKIQFKTIPLLQILYLTVFPIALYLVALSFIFNTHNLPYNPIPVLSDPIIIGLMFCAIMYVHTGVVIHFIGKDLFLLFKKNEIGLPAYELDEFFHMQFSHFIIYSGTFVGFLLGALLELNHLPQSNWIIFSFTVIVGIIFSFCEIMATVLYRSSRKDHMRIFLFNFFISVIFIILVRNHLPFIYLYPVGFIAMMFIINNLLLGVKLILKR